MPISKNLNIVLIAMALSVPGISFANTQYHLVDGEAGYKEFPGHVKPSGLERSDVIRELQKSRADGSLAALSRGNALQNTRDQAKGSTLTREQVRAEAMRPGQRNSNASSIDGEK
ncbi:DUF4148 domain-containing protein [Acidovorax sp. 106]|uniref:DUF4148 domain-containing protein n=1 Tax=Acidovorax sp. 106 TaxID=2135637 RepID=UPI000F2622B7|nr:DUF4148 domain-containing protein [Acidovorax sp. 106]RLJ40029.1 hypothetical protein C8C98_3785 [Acidovorax sp. 106]